jgi:hypothetical protein
VAVVAPVTAIPPGRREEQVRRQAFKGHGSANVKIHVGVAFDAGEKLLRDLRRVVKNGKKKVSANAEIETVHPSLLLWTCGDVPAV